MGGADLTMRAVKEPPPHPCPYCGQDIRPMVWTVGDRFEILEAPSPYDAALLWSECPSCCEELYLLELTIIPRVDERQFLNDCCWKAEKTKLFKTWSSAFPQPWLVIEHRKVTGVSVCEPNGKIETFNVSWLEEHIVAGWTAGDRQEAFAVARDLARLLLANRGDLKAGHRLSSA